MVPRLVQLLAPVVDAGQLVVITDADGRVLWRSGNAGVRRMADDLGFVDGSAWTEGNVGTNAIGTALVLGEPFFIQGAEHFVESHARWGCAAAPIADPWTGRTLGVVDVSGPSRGLHPAELALVEMAARVCSLEVLEQHRAGARRAPRRTPLRCSPGSAVRHWSSTGTVTSRQPRACRCAQPDRASGRHGRRARSGCRRSGPRSPRPCPAAGCSPSRPRHDLGATARRARPDR